MEVTDTIIDFCAGRLHACAGRRGVRCRESFRKFPIPPPCGTLKGATLRIGATLCPQQIVDNITIFARVWYGGEGACVGAWVRC